MSLITANTTFSSSLAYRKVAFYGEFQTTGNADYTITHNLGYVPGYAAWVESFPGQMWVASAGGTQDPYDPDGSKGQLAPYATDTTLVLSYTGAAGRTICYRIYYDN